MNEKRIHQIFEISILLKGAHALVEFGGGLALAFIDTNWIKSTVNAMTQDELVEDPHDFLATHLMDFVQGFTVSTEHFYAFYLVSHGLVKLALVTGLLREKLWAYPAALVALALFIAYQVYRYSYTQSIGLIVLTIFDLFFMWLIWHEYRLRRSHSQPHLPSP